MTEQKLEIIQYNQKQHYKEGVYKILGIKAIEQPSLVSYFTPVQYLVECKNGEFRYSMNGEIFRIEQNTKYATILTNIDQVQKLKWGTQNLQYTVKWCPIWEARIIINAGGEVNKNNLKIGKWVELSDNYCNISQVTHEGIYNNGLRNGKWITYFKENIICEGEYNLKGVEIGKWEHVHDRFSNNYQIIYQGEYKNGKKFGQWNIIDITTQNKLIIGGGFYGTEGEKIGKWTELHNNFVNFKTLNKYSCQILWKGYYRNGKKIGKWDIHYSKELKSVDNFESIGGGLYDETEQKQGIWIELLDNFSNCSQVRSFGEYNNGKTIGRWNIQFRDEKKDNFIIIGGGQYDDEGKQKGKWIELYHNFRSDIQLRFVGDYKEGIKQGFWGLQFRNYFHKDFPYCSGGTYDFGQKNGKWNELQYTWSFFSMYKQLQSKVQIQFFCLEIAYINSILIKEQNQLPYRSLQEWQVIKLELDKLRVQSLFQDIQCYIINKTQLQLQIFYHFNCIHLNNFLKLNIFHQSSNLSQLAFPILAIFTQCAKLTSFKNNDIPFH